MAETRIEDLAETPRARYATVRDSVAEDLHTAAVGLEGLARQARLDNRPAEAALYERALIELRGVLERLPRRP